MGCLSMTVQLQPQAALAVQPSEQAKLSVRGYPSGEPHTTAALSVVPKDPASLVLSPVSSAVLSVEMASGGAELVIGEVCNITTGEIYVLAASDGPLRTIDGGYILLDPAGEQD